MTTRVKSDDSQPTTSKTQTRITKPAAPATGKRDTGRNPPSTFVSSPVTARSNKKKGKAVATLDDDSDDDQVGYSHGYTMDEFMEPDDDDDDFETMPHSRSFRRTREPVGPPISHDTYMTDAGLSEIHQDIINGFVATAEKLQEDLLNKKGLRQRWFTQNHFREMAVRGTDTLDKMYFIPDIESEKVDRYGRKFLPLIKSCREQYEAVSSTAPPATANVGSSSRDVVDLVSSSEDDQQMGDDEDILDYEAEGETSSYFTGSVMPSEPSEEVLRYHRELERLQQEDANASSSRARSKSSASRGRGSRGGKRSYPRRFSGGSSRGGRSGAGVRKRAAPGERKSTAGSGSAARTARGGARGGGGSSIGLMKY